MYLAHYTKRFIPEFDAECRFNEKVQSITPLQEVFDMAHDMFTDMWDIRRTRLGEGHEALRAEQKSVELQIKKLV